MLLKRLGEGIVYIHPAENRWGRRTRNVLFILVCAPLAEGCAFDLVPARLTRPDEAAAAAAATERKQAESREQIERALGRVLLMSGDSNRPYEVLGPVTESGESAGVGVSIRGMALFQGIEVSAFDRLKLAALDAFGDDVDAVIGLVCQGLTCTGTAVRWAED